MFVKATVPKPLSPDEEYARIVEAVQARPIVARSQEEEEAHWQGVYELRMQKHRIEQARAQVEAQRRQESVDCAVEVAKAIDSEEAGKRWWEQHFCTLVQSKRF